MEGLYLSQKDITNIIKYYDISNDTTKQDINKLLNKSNPTTSEINRLKRYSFRYKMIMQHISDNTDARLNKLYRKPLTSPNKDID